MCVWLSGGKSQHCWIPLRYAIQYNTIASIFRSRLSGLNDLLRAGTVSLSLCLFQTRAYISRCISWFWELLEQWGGNSWKDKHNGSAEFFTPSVNGADMSTVYINTEYRIRVIVCRVCEAFWGDSHKVEDVIEARLANYSGVESSVKLESKIFAWFMSWIESLFP